MIPTRYKTQLHGPMNANWGIVRYSSTAAIVAITTLVIPSHRAQYTYFHCQHFIARDKTSHLRLGAFSIVAMLLEIGR